MKKKIKNLAFFALKMIISSAILFVVFFKVQKDQGALWAESHGGENLWLGMIGLVLSSNPFLVAAAVLSNIAGIMQSVIRWHVLLTSHGNKIKYFTTVKIQFIGYLYNNILPASIGMDAIRGAYAYSITKKKGEVLSSLLADRFFGLIGMILLGIICFPFYFNVHLAFLIFAVEVGVLVCMAAFLILFSNDRFFAFITGYFKKLHIFKIGSRFVTLYEAFKNYTDKPTTAAKAIFFSMLLQLFLTFNMFFLAKALNLTGVSFGSLLGYLPFINIVSMIPTPGGLGPREASVVLLLGNAGCSSAEALTLSLFYYTVSLAVSLSGLVFLPMMKFGKGGMDEV
ncbi:flippase-like domain-containing protein [candidate division WOR-3 bacterium]|nr:flippase-like domain-containing protein [candidate division WOR-3 bacterium]